MVVEEFLGHGSAVRMNNLNFLMSLDAKIIWFIAGLVMILLEFVAPGIVIIFFGIGAWIVSLALCLGVIESVPMQCTVFAISSLLLLFLLRRYVTSWFVGNTLNQGCNVDEEFIGKKVNVVKAIGGGEDTGKIELKGAEWNAYCQVPLDVGSHATIVKREGIHFIVEPNK